MSLNIITYANHTNNPGYDNFINSMEKNNINYTIIGSGEVWEGFDTKMKSCLKKLNSYPENNIVCIIDCFDVIANNGPTDIIYYRFLKYNKPIVFGVESRFFFLSSNGIKLSNWWNKNKEKYGRNKNASSLNGGTIIGYVKDLKHMINFAIDNKFTDDQLAYHYYAEKFPDKIALDLSSSIFGNYPFNDVFRFKFFNGKMFDMKSLCCPCFIHIPGTSGDLNLRMNHVGKNILKEKYKSFSFPETIKISSKKILSKSNRKSLYLVLTFVVLIIVLAKFIKSYFKNKKINKESK